jgi:hypothetical protein
MASLRACALAARADAFFRARHIFCVAQRPMLRAHPHHAGTPSWKHDGASANCQKR